MSGEPVGEYTGLAAERFLDSLDKPVSVQPVAYFQDEEHALHTGMFIGSLMKAGFQVIVEMDAEQNYTNLMTIVFPGDRFVDEFSIHLAVLSGPEETTT